MSLGGLFNEITSGANTAPCPQVGSAPPGPPPRRAWQAPDVSGAGQVTVHRDDLHTAAGVIRSCLPELDAAVHAVQQHTGAFDSLQGWEAANQMMENLLTAVQGFAQLGGQASDAHTAHAKKLTDSAAAYAEAEQRGTQAANSSYGSAGGSSAGLK